MPNAPWDGTPVPELSALDRMFSKTKGQIFLHGKASGFLGSLLCSHRFVWDEEHFTVWCNGETIAFNPRFFLWLKPESRLTVLAHELLHTAFDHMGRRGDRCPDYWNQAVDHVVNNLLVDWGFDFSQLMGINPCLDRKYADMTSEEVYALLGPPPGGGGSGQAGASGPGSPTLDPSNPMHGDVRNPPNSTAAADVKAKQVAAIQAAQMAKEAGDLPGEIVLLVEKFLNPILPWEKLLARFYTDLSKNDFSWKRPSRRYEDEYLPSLDGDNRLEHLIYYMDVSGSVSDDEILRFFSEVKHIHAEHQPRKITLVTFDEMIQNELELAWDDPFDKIEITGRGGTSLNPVYQHILDHRPTAAIIFSDLICHPMKRDPRSPLLWVVVNNKAAKVYHGQKIHINV
jgi:predicted metal-dependent peptidase